MEQFWLIYHIETNPLIILQQHNDAQQSRTCNMQTMMNMLKDSCSCLYEDINQSCRGAYNPICEMSVQKFGDWNWRDLCVINDDSCPSGYQSCPQHPGRSPKVMALFLLQTGTRFSSIFLLHGKHSFGELINDVWYQACDLVRLTQQHISIICIKHMSTIFRRLQVNKW